MPPFLRERFMSRSGRFMLQVHPKENIWQRDKQEEFVRELRTVDPNVTGTPVQLLEYTTLLKNSYLQAALYSLIAMAILVFAHFRNPLCVVLALVPVAIGSLWMTGLMGLFRFHSIQPTS